MEKTLYWITIICAIIAILAFFVKDIPSYYKLVRRISLPTSRQKHILQLKNFIQNIPFIYGEEHGNVLRDFVYINFKEIHLGFPGDPYIQENNELIADELIINKRSLLPYRDRLVFLANAGMGKTTFLSFLALSIGLRRSNRFYSRFFPRQKQAFPIFVPLKLLNNSSQRPILDYILSNYNYFRRNPYGKIIKLAQNKELIIILDGYDEVLLDSENLLGGIKHDIECFFNSMPNVNHQEQADKRIHLFYENLRNNKIWMTSRKDYYLDNRLDYEISDYDLLRFPDLVAIELLGLSNKMQLVKNIFNRYRAKSKFHHEYLNEDVFFKYISRKSDGDLLSLTNNPLFLTIMCYVYVKNLEHPNKSEGDIISIRSLIVSCIKYLLKDLDKNKVRSLPEGIKLALVEKRGLYYNEKFEFLGHFANLLYRDEKLFDQRVFSKAKLIQIAKQFFLTKPKNPVVSEILSGLESNGTNNIIRQLIEQDIFVKVNKLDRYDFPHLRFREVMALEYLDNEENIHGLVNNLGKKHYREFIIFFFGNSKSYSGYLLENMLKETNDSKNRDYFFRLIVDCVTNYNRKNSYQEIVFSWLKSINDHEIFIPIEIIQLVVTNQLIKQWIEKGFVESLSQNDFKRMYFFSHILVIINPKLIVEILNAKLKSKNNDKEVQSLISTAIKLDVDIIKTSLVFLETDQKAIYELGVNLSRNSDFQHNHSWLSILIKGLNIKTIATLHKAITTTNNKLFYVVLGLSKKSKFESTILKFENSDKDVFIYSKQIFDSLDLSSETGELFKKFNEGIYFNDKLDLIYENTNLEDLVAKKDKSAIRAHMVWTSGDWNKFIEYI